MWRILDQGREPLREKLAGLAGASPEEIAVMREPFETSNADLSRELSDVESKIARSLDQEILAQATERKWDIENFVQSLAPRIMLTPRQSPKVPISEWLANKTLEWHQQLYAMLSKHSSGSRYQAQQQLAERLKLLPIIRLSSSGYYG